MTSKEALKDLRHRIQALFITMPNVYDDIKIIEKDLEMLEENKDILTDLINYEIARLKMAMFMCDNEKIHIIRLSKLEKIKELLNEN